VYKRKKCPVLSLTRASDDVQIKFKPCRIYIPLMSSYITCYSFVFQGNTPNFICYFLWKWEKDELAHASSKKRISVHSVLIMHWWLPIHICFRRLHRSFGSCENSRLVYTVDLLTELSQDESRFPAICHVDWRFGTLHMAKIHGQVWLLCTPKKRRLISHNVNRTINSAQCNMLKDTNQTETDNEKYIR
jgi:hypothetical protein